MKKLILTLGLMYCGHALTAQIVYRPVKPIAEAAEITGNWMLGCTRSVGFTKACKDFTVKFNDAPWSFTVSEVMKFDGAFLLSSKSEVIIRLANGKKGQKFTVQITASAANSGNLSFYTAKGDNLGNLKLSGNNKNAPVSVTYESTGESGKEYLKLSCPDYWNLEKIEIASIKK